MPYRFQTVLQNNSECSTDHECNAWYEAVLDAGFDPGIYIGPNSGLGGASLYHDLRFASYWRSASKVPEVERRGWQLTQSRSTKAHGVFVDFDVCSVDHLGGRPTWLAPV